MQSESTFLHTSKQMKFTMKCRLLFAVFILLGLAFYWYATWELETEDSLLEYNQLVEAKKHSADLEKIFSSGLTRGRVCTTFAREFLPTDDRKHPNDAPDFPIAFTIVAHKDFARLARLFRMIYRPQNAYCIHIDSRSTPEFRRAVKELTMCYAGDRNVVLVKEKESVAVNWGDASVIQPQMICARKLLTSVKINWKYVVNCVGQEFPLRTNVELVEALKALKGANLIESTSNTELWRLFEHKPPFEVR